MKKCICIGAGECNETMIDCQDAFIIAVDGGYDHCLRLGIVPDCLVGDFDSVQAVLPAIETISSSPIKDDTDMMMAINEAIQRGYDTFELYGAMGGRFEHTFANIQLLHQFRLKGIQMKMIHDNQIVQVIHNEKLIFDESYSGYLSLFSLTDISEGVTLKNLKYELENAQLSNTYPLGIDNEFIGKAASVEVKQGTLCCIISK